MIPSLSFLVHKMGIDPDLGKRQQPRSPVFMDTKGVEMGSEPGTGSP